jgi:hypothetical protein
LTASPPASFIGRRGRHPHQSENSFVLHGLSGLSVIRARVRNLGVVSEICKHLAMAIAAVVVNKIVGTRILSQIGWLRPQPK